MFLSMWHICSLYLSPYVHMLDLELFVDLQINLIFIRYPVQSFSVENKHPIWSRFCVKSQGIHCGYRDQAIEIMCIQQKKNPVPEENYFFSRYYSVSSVRISSIIILAENRCRGIKTRSKLCLENSHTQSTGYIEEIFYQSSDLLDDIELR